MSEFGIQWADTPFILPIQNGKVMVDTGVITSVESSPTGAVTNELGNTGVVVSGVKSTLQSHLPENVYKSNRKLNIITILALFLSKQKEF